MQDNKNKKSDTPLEDKNGTDISKDTMSWLPMNGKQEDEYSPDFDSDEEESIAEECEEECEDGQDDIDLILGGLDAFDEGRSI